MLVFQTRLFTRTLGALALALASLAGLPSSANAHTDLVSSEPAAGAEVRLLPRTVLLTFSEDIDPMLSAGTLSGGSARDAVTFADGRSVGEIVATVPSTLTSASSGTTEWRLNYRVVSRDGHPISGSLQFEVTGGRSESTSTPGQSPRADADQSPSSDAAVGGAEDTGAGDSGARNSTAEDGNEDETSPIVKASVPTGVIALVVLLGWLARRQVGRYDGSQDGSRRGSLDGSRGGSQDGSGDAPDKSQAPKEAEH